VVALVLGRCGASRTLALVFGGVDLRVVEQLAAVGGSGSVACGRAQ
jgi:hypothetical protein